MIDQELSDSRNERWTQILKSLLQDRSGLSILDVGTGPGYFSILLSRLGHRVTAIDSSKEMLAKARINTEKHRCDVELVLSDLLDFALPESYDIIISRNVTWTLPDPINAYKKWFSWLKCDGQVIILDANWNFHLTDPAAATLQEAVNLEAAAAGYVPYRSEKEIGEGDRITLTLPLSYVARPDWDIAMLRPIGFKETTVRQGFDEGLYTPAEQVLNKHRPMFAITAFR
ncbi:class I SAM-dependent methyltransferase [Cohnella sp. GbtcB17]|uniref:class I SAM-dependent methyltransferase n=1 Tax=Cohnella sp. GbtcB17 TaxID=2824762 RepID=UPI0034D7A3B4